MTDADFVARSEYYKYYVWRDATMDGANPASLFKKGGTKNAYCIFYKCMNTVLRLTLYLCEISVAYGICRLRLVVYG